MSNTVTMIPVASSQISSIGYDEEVEDLYITFSNGTTCIYEDVPKKIFKEFKESDSKGKYFNSKIRGKYKFYKK